MKQLLWLGAVWPLVFFPFLADPTPVGVRGTGTYATESDTTYADGRYAALVPGVTDTITQGANTMIRFIPDPDSIGTGVPYRAIREPGGNDYLVLSYDTLVTAALDSSQVDSIWSDWGLGTPLAYAVDVPGKPSDMADLGITTAESTLIAAVAGFAYKATPYTPVYYALADYNDSLTTIGTSLWNSKTVPIWNNEMYYDRAMLIYEHWWRTGDTSRLVQADSYVVNYRDLYVLPNVDALYECTAAKWSFPEGLAVHYLLREDSVSRNAVAHMARCNSGPESTRIDNAPDTTYIYIDGRIQGRALLTVVIAAALDLPAREYDGTAISVNWDSLADVGADSILMLNGRSQAGLGPTTGRWYLRSYCYTQANFQVSHALLYGLARYSDLLDDGSKADTIETVVAASLDTILSYRKTYLGQPVITYTSWESYTCGGTDPVDTTALGGKDLNGLYVGMLGWAFDKTGDSTYWYMADSLTGAMLDVTYWRGQGGKAYNQSFWQSQRAIIWLNGGP